MKKCRIGYYYCNTDKKCKKIPLGYHVGRGGYVEPDDDTKNGNGNGNGHSNGGSGNGNGGNGNGGNGNGGNGNGGNGNGGGMGESYSWRKDFGLK